MMEGHEVTVVDNFFTGRKRNVEHWIGHENFELLNHDVINPLFIEGLFYFYALHFNVLIFRNYKQSHVLNLIIMLIKL